MCGRYTLYHDGVELRGRFVLSSAYEQHMKARWNIASGSETVAITGAQPRIPLLMSWGLIPSWAKDPKIGFKMINARGADRRFKPV
jgi:putative SOS response-associated peptidase YedK